MADVQPTTEPYADEQWRAIPGTDGFYEASTHGRVRSVDRVVTKSDNRDYRLKGRVLKPHTMTSGHLRVNIKIRGVAFEPLVHRLVMLAFVGPCPEGMEVCHGDGDPSNNYPSNLRYGTRSDNMYDASKHGSHWQKVKKVCPRGHVLEDPNLVSSKSVSGGQRNCLACNRGRSYAKYHGILDDLQKVSDSYYEDIMRTAA